jgi:hypothetical protein
MPNMQIPETDKCIGCGNESPAELLFYEGVEPNVHSPRYKWCLIKEAQELYGQENVILGNEN